uniref:hypothetical protein n=1 Tax=Pseudomonas fluorescens TaxID=294 RepID=UPI00130E3233|nr:hypothetical protein [Pseudomonas fluorescens]
MQAFEWHPGKPGVPGRRINRLFANGKEALIIRQNENFREKAGLMTLRRITNCYRHGAETMAK